MVTATTTVERQRVGSDVQFESFYGAERSRLYRALAMSLGDVDLAADAVDEGMARAYQRWRRVSGYDNPAGWVYRVAFNWGVSRHRKRSRRAPWPPPREPGVTDPDPTSDPELDAALAALPAQQRAVVVLRFHLDWQLDQIAAALGVPTGTVKSRLHRGLAALRDELGEQEGSA